MTEYQEREQVWSAVEQLERQRCFPAIREARQLLIAWLKQHPNDYASLDVNQELVRMEGALEVIEEQKAAELVAA